jgi:uncharacterized protein (DUF2235 family)
LRMYGLIRPGNAPLVRYVVRMMMAIQAAHQQQELGKRLGKESEDAVTRYFKLAEDFKSTMSRADCQPHFVGVWDTVSSIGWKDRPLKLPFITDNPEIAIGRHAISIDEHRAFFRSHRWIHSRELSEHGPRDVKQVWFPGVHCDVGGGYPEAESGLSKVALEWMLEEAKAAGLCVDAAREAEVLGRTPNGAYAKPDPDGRAHESLKGAWKIAEWIRKPHYDFNTGTVTMRANHGRRRTIPPKSLVHEAAFLRQGGEYAKTRVPEDAIRVRTQPAPPAAACGAKAVESVLQS